MARETKVGLLAGLAFIICFAIILANRGQSPRTGVSQPSLVDGGDAVRRPAESLDAMGGSRQVRRSSRPKTHIQNQRPSTSAARSASSERLDSPAARREVAGYASSAPLAASTGASLPGTMASVPVRPKVLRDESSSSNIQPTQSPVRHRMPPSIQEQQQLLREKLAAANRSKFGVPVRRDQEASQRERQASSADDTGSKAATKAPPVRSTAAPGRKKKAPASGVRYVVSSGDTLSRIAKAQYGTLETAVINAIFAANRGVLSDPNVLQVGMKLALPRIDGQRSPSGSATRTSKPTAKPSEATTTASLRQPLYRWYQIRKNDRYVTIAREQLGDQKRWRDIYELNKDKFPDPDEIREGVRIKLPANTLAQSTRSRD